MPHQQNLADFLSIKMEIKQVFIKNIIDQINFEKMFYGNKSKIKGFIVNNTPKKISFK